MSIKVALAMVGITTLIAACSPSSSPTSEEGTIYGGVEQTALGQATPGGDAGASDASSMSDACPVAAAANQPPAVPNNNCQYINPPRPSPQSTTTLYSQNCNAGRMCPTLPAAGCTAFSFQSGAGVVNGQNCPCIATPAACAVANIANLIGPNGLDSNTFATRQAAQAQLSACCTNPAYLQALKDTLARGGLSLEVQRRLEQVISSCGNGISNCYDENLTVDSSYACVNQYQHAPPPNPPGYTSGNVGVVISCNNVAGNWIVGFSVYCPSTVTTWLTNSGWSDTSLVGLFNCSTSSGSSESGYQWNAGPAQPAWCQNTILGGVLWRPGDIAAARNAIAAALNQNPAGVCQGSVQVTGTGNALTCEKGC